MKVPRSVLQVTDSLQPGGAERVAVLLANDLARMGIRSRLWPTRQRGPLEAMVADGVDVVDRPRRGRIGVAAIHSVARSLGRGDVIHAHGTSLGAGLLLRAAAGWRPSLLWHDHYGRHDVAPRAARRYGLAARAGVQAVATVTHDLERWNRAAMPWLPGSRIRFLPNYSTLGPDPCLPTELAGAPGSRLVAVGHVSTQKDHRTLVEAMALVAEHQPGAHLTILGAIGGDGAGAEVRARIDELGLGRTVTLAGVVPSVAGHLAAADIGVLSSRSEGFPMALVEYGIAGLGAVVTDVGECSHIVAGGTAGLVVPPSDPEALAGAIVRLVTDARLRQRLGAALRARVEQEFSRDTVVSDLLDRYADLLGDRKGRHGG